MPGAPPAAAAAFDAERRKADGVVLQESEEGIAGVGAGFGNEQRIAVPDEAFAGLGERRHVEVRRQDVYARGAKPPDVMHFRLRAAAGKLPRPRMAGSCSQVLPYIGMSYSALPAAATLLTYIE